MPTVLGYSPQAKFAYNRSYCPFIRVAWGYAITSIAGRVISGLVTVGSDTYYAVITLRSNFYNWSSNSYTLDYPVELAIAGLNGVPYGDLPIDVQWTYPPYSDQQGLQVNQTGLTTYIFDFDLPPPPGNYWLQPPFFHS